MKAIVHIVDDDPSFRRATSRLLRAAGHDVAVYESAEQLLARLPGKDEPGCILLDVLMPGLSGPALRERLTNLGSAMPVVFLTGSVEPVDGLPEDTLLKPVAKGTLLEAIERALSVSSAANDQSGKRM